MFTEEEEKFAEFFGYSPKLIYLEDIMENFKEKVIKEDGSYSTYGNDIRGYKFIVKPEYVEDVNNMCKYVGCKFKGGISEEEIKLEKIAEERKKKEQEALENFDKINDLVENKEQLKKAIMQLIEGLGNANAYGVYSLGRSEQYELWKKIEGYKIETSLSRVLKKLGVRISYGERDPKTNWSQLYIYDDDYKVDENLFDDYVDSIIKDYDNWIYVDSISDLMKLKYNKYYIYGIMINNELVYIGKTYRGLRERILEHLVRDNNANKKLYELFETEDFHLVILCEECGKYSKIKNDIELQVVEKKLIEYYKPLCNVQGVNKPYVFK